ncbi:DUF3325 domain-containing protein [Halopseudomonas pachastrellae]|uniref:DUF3325 domain-containing protein n=1 Tax=Halopseudomonas pachastrellae TaxID=254161 RepID=UPI003D7CFE5A
MPKHFEAACGGKPAAAQGRALRLLGWGLLPLALWPAVRAAGPSVGFALWAAALTPAAMFSLLLLSYRPRWLSPLLSLVSAISPSTRVSRHSR